MNHNCKQRIPVALGLVLLAGVAVAQQWSAALPVVGKSGVYRILLSPELVGRSQEDLGDIRLLDSSGVAVPYVLEVSGRGETFRIPRPFEVTRNVIEGKRTVVEFTRSPGRVVDAIHLRVRNAEAVKQATLTGSDDGASWYFIKEDLLTFNGSTDTTNELRMIALPTSDYRAYRITINDSLTPPVQVLGALWYDRASGTGEYAQVPSLTWQQSDSAGSSWIACALPYPATFDRLAFAVADTGLFLREAAIMLPHNWTTGRGKKQRTHHELRATWEFPLSSGDAGRFDVPAFTADTFWIRIRNKDDRPLRFTLWEGQQLQRWLLAQLQNGTRHSISTCDPKRTAPEYDLVRFHDRLGDAVASLAHGPLTAIDPADDHTGPLFDPSKIWIWVLLIAVLALVAGLAWKMLRTNPTGT